jgi:prevent-host-death family protein
MATYSTQEARAKLGEILRKVRAGERVVIAYRGKHVAEIRPITKKTSALEAALRDLEEQGIVSPAAASREELVPVTEKPGALARFLESRD